jgi:hypothetical protein
MSTPDRTWLSWDGEGRGPSIAPAPPKKRPRICDRPRWRDGGRPLLKPNASQEGRSGVVGPGSSEDAVTRASDFLTVVRRPLMSLRIAQGWNQSNWPTAPGAPFAELGANSFALRSVTGSTPAVSAPL